MSFDCCVWVAMVTYPTVCSIQRVDNSSGQRGVLLFHFLQRERKYWYVYLHVHRSKQINSVCEHSRCLYTCVCCACVLCSVCICIFVLYVSMYECLNVHVCVSEQSHVGCMFVSVQLCVCGDKRLVFTVYVKSGCSTLNKIGVGGWR